MRANEIKQIVRELEDRGTSLAAIGREHGCSRQFVSKVLRDPKQSRAVRALIVKHLGRDPWAPTTAKASTAA